MKPAILGQNQKNFLILDNKFYILKYIKDIKVSLIYFGI